MFQSCFAGGRCASSLHISTSTCHDYVQTVEDVAGRLKLADLTPAAVHRLMERLREGPTALDKPQWANIWRPSRPRLTTVPGSLTRDLLWWRFL
eukprot:6390891-Pyramimonas_sp.AAC.1